MIGAGFRNFGPRRTAALASAVALLTFAFAADTLTTAVAGPAARDAETNPLVSDLTLAPYLASAVLRWLASGLLLLWFWPTHLEPRFRHRRLSLFHPLAFRDAKAYFGAVLILVGAVVKIAAAAHNLVLLVRGDPLARPLVVIAVGCIAGLPIASSLLFRHERSLAGR